MSHSDIAREGSAFCEYLSFMSIIFTASSSYTPQTSGVTKQLIRTLKIQASVMIIETGRNDGGMEEAMKKVPCLRNGVACSICNVATNRECF